MAWFTLDTCIRSRRSPLAPPAASCLLLALGLGLAATAAAALHTHVSPDGLTTAPCTCRPATAAERADLTIAPDGFVQDDPRDSYRRTEVPLPIVPDWVGTRVRAVGVLLFGDADRDGDQDLFVGTYFANQWPPLADYYNFMYLNTGGALENEPSWISADQKHTGDAEWGLLNVDSYPDLFLANGGQSLQPSQVFYGQDGLLPNTAGWSSSDATWTIGCALADFDQDGDVDVATANQGNTANPYRPTHIFRNLGTGLEPVPSWSSAQIGITNDVDWGDMDGDDRLDLAVSGWVNWQSGVFRNLGSTLETGFAWTTGHPERTDKGIGWALVDGDARPDLAVGGNGAADWIFRNEGSALGATPIWASAEAYHGCQDLKWADIDNDGDLDLAIMNFSTGHARIYLNTNGVLPTIADWQYDAAVSGTALAFGDVNGDGRLDLAIGTANGPVELFLNTGGAAAAGDAGAPAASARLRIAFAPHPIGPASRLLLDADRPFAIERLTLADAAGRRVALAPAITGPARHHELAAPIGAAGRLAAGVYFLTVSGRDETGRTMDGTARVVLLVP